MQKQESIKDNEVDLHNVNFEKFHILNKYVRLMNS